MTPLFRSLVRALALFSLLSFEAEGAGCLPLTALDGQIRYCTDNGKAARSAEACVREVEQAWEKASAQLARFSPEGGTQRLGYGLSQEEYDAAAEKLRSLLALTERNADLLAHYPSVMVDAPGIASFAESLPCFREVYGQLQAKVSQLDARVRSGRRVLAGALRLRAESRTLAQAGQALPGHGAARSVLGAGAAKPLTKRASASDSDISGLKRLGE